jgi:hypothetical protein
MMIKGNLRLRHPSGADGRASPFPLRFRFAHPNSLLSMGLQRLIKVVSRKQRVAELTSFLKGGVIGRKRSKASLNT